MKRKPAPREVVRVISAKELLYGPDEVRVPTLIRGGHVEIREHVNGSYTVHYPEEGWIPSKPSEIRPFTEVHEIFASVEDAFVVADAIAEEREVKLVPSKKRKRDGV